MLSVLAGELEVSLVGERAIIRVCDDLPLALLLLFRVLRIDISVVQRIIWIRLPL